jgi:multiple antibiotic resistance protein
MSLAQAPFTTRGFEIMHLSDFYQLASAILLILGALLPVVNPLGDAPIFLTMTAGCDAMTRAELAKRISLYSFVLLVFSMFLGSFVLRLFDLSIPVVQVAGGAVVCALGWNLLAEKPKPAAVTEDLGHTRQIALGRAFYPLTMPLTIDAGAIAVAVTLGANHAHTIKNAIIQFMSVTIGAAIVALMILLTYRYAEAVGRRIGRTGMIIMVRLSAFIMVCIGVGITWNGVKSLLAQIGIHGS